MLDWDDLTARSVLTCPKGGWKPDAIAAAIDAVVAEATIAVGREKIGESFEGRPIELITVGEGPKRALMWSQMHGDEPTHTSMLLNLLKMLVSADNPAERLLRGLTIGMILPLNPDGAERNTRHNAQGIDVNRDALEFATPEGRALRSAIEGFKPDCGFNLHNQHYRTAIGSPPEPAAVSLLVPPLDLEDSQTDSVKRAVLVAATFCERVREAALGRVSRYDADFMARAFGEWVQRQGVSVILIEAGGWPDRDFVVLERMHLAAFAQTLDAMAATALGESDGLEACDPASYHDLQRSSPYHLFDLQIASRGVAQLRGETDEPFLAPAEVGIDYPHRMAGWYEFRDGVFSALGDLHENGGISAVETDEIVLPGRLVLTDDSPATIDWDTLTRVGSTTALIPVNLADEAVIDFIHQASSQPPVMNATFVVRWDGPEAGDRELLDRLTAAVGAGAVATIGELPRRVVEACCRLGLPALEPAVTPTLGSPVPDSVSAWLVETRRVASQLGWPTRGQIALNAPADFVLAAPAGDAIAQDCLRSIYVGGTVARDASGLLPGTPGRWLKWSGPS